MKLKLQVNNKTLMTNDETYLLQDFQGTIGIGKCFCHHILRVEIFGDTNGIQICKNICCEKHYNTIICGWFEIV